LTPTKDDSVAGDGTHAPTGRLGLIFAGFGCNILGLSELRQASFVCRLHIFDKMLSKYFAGFTTTTTRF